MRKQSEFNLSGKPGVAGFPFDKDPVQGLADRQLKRGTGWVSTYGGSTPSGGQILGRSIDPAKQVEAMMAADLEAKMQREARRVQARQRDIDTLSRTIYGLPDLYNQDRDRLIGYVNRNLPAGVDLQAYATGLKRVSQTVLEAARQGPAGIAWLAQEENEAKRLSSPFAAYDANMSSAGQPGSLEDRMLALDSMFGNDPTYRRRRDVIKYRVQGNAQRDASPALALKHDPDADLKTALHVIGRRDLNAQYGKRQFAQRIQDRIESDTANHADEIRATNPNFAAGEDQVVDFFRQTGEMSPGQMGKARVDRKIADARNPDLQAYKALNLDLLKIPAGALRSVPGLIWEAAVGSGLEPEMRDTQRAIFTDSGVFNQLANFLPGMSILDKFATGSDLAEAAARDRSLKPFVQFGMDQLNAMNPLEQVRSILRKPQTAKDLVDSAFGGISLGLGAIDKTSGFKKRIDAWSAKRGRSNPPLDEDPGASGGFHRVAEGEPKFEDLYETYPPTRPGTNRKQIEDGLDAAMDLLVGKNRKRPRLRMLALAINAAMRSQKGIVIKGLPAKSHLDVATIAQVLRDPRFETLRYILVKDGKVVHVEGVSSRMPASSGLFPFHKFGLKEQDDDVYHKWLGDMLDKHEADGFYVLHNHPSGISEPSDDDKESTANVARNGKFLGHVIINSKEYSFISPSGDVSPRIAVDFHHGEQDPLFKAREEGSLLGSPVTLRNILAFARSLKKSRNWITIVGLSGGGKIV